VVALEKASRAEVDSVEIVRDGPGLVVSGAVKMGAASFLSSDLSAGLAD